MGLSVDIEKKLKDMTLKISFETQANEGITGILGASGCGKSMTLKCIAGIVKPDKGRIVLNGRVLFDSEKRIHVKIQERRTGYLFQNYALFPHMTILQNVEIAIQNQSKSKRDKALGYLKLLHLEEVKDSYPACLSGGQQQRAALARILASEPDVLMLDEPFSALDYYLKEHLQMELLELLKRYEGDILMVTHSRDEIYRFCSQIHILDKGQKVISGSVQEVFDNPQVVAAAKLTGCKNIVKVNRLSSHSLQIPQWNLQLQFDRKVPDKVEYIGIRAHFLRKKTQQELAGQTEGKYAGHNVIFCQTYQLVEDPFEMTVIINGIIWWKVSKKDWKHIYGETVPKELVIPQESVLFLRA